MTSQKMTTYGIPYMSGDEIRKSFFEYFEKQDHKFIKSSGVFPKDDPTLLFTNSGMNQFKAIFLGENKDGLKRAYNSQKCLRVSGKHNDLDEVGRDTYHHTFFEMLGNWSFGDYYKKEAITWAWDLITNVWKMPKDRLYVTVHHTDDEARELWKTLTDIPHDRIMDFDKDNFWEMGAVGPCGTSSEIHFDLGDMATQKDTYDDKHGGVNGEDGRYVEIWNLVFMQNERMQDGSLRTLEQTHVDTGAGFERLCSIIQGSGSNYETDVFEGIIQGIAKLSGVAYDKGEAGTPHRVIADHVRALSFAITDGATPGNEGRGYVLRRILRRASRFANSLGQKEPFLYNIVPFVVETMQGAFPEIAQRKDYVMQVIQSEESRFLKTLDGGLKRINKLAEELKSKKKDMVPGKDVFTLYDTYGFPMDLTGIIAEEHGLKIDEKGYEVAMEEQRERARGAAKFDAGFSGDEGWTIFNPSASTNFIGYNQLESEVKVNRYKEENDSIFVVTDRSPFYAESGGQVGDIGTFKNDQVELKVEDTFKVLDMWVHRCALINGLVEKSSMGSMQAKVDVEYRENTFRNHSATHLLHAALKKVLGEHVAQQGSYVGPDRLRFDFTHHKGMTQDEINQVEQMVNQEILQNYSVASEVKSFDQAKEEGAMALFGEKYGDEVRTIKMGDFSYELCGGTHAKATGDIGLCVITNESSIAAGIRRLEAITGAEALHLAKSQMTSIKNMEKSLKVKPGQLEEKIIDLSASLKAAEKELAKLQTERVNMQIDALISQDRIELSDAYGVVKRIKGADFPKKTHQTLLDSLSGKLNNGVAIFTCVDGENLSILSAVGKDLKGRVKAGDIVKELAKVADGRGGGRPDKAQAGSKFPEKENDVIQAAQKLLQDSLN